MEKEDLGDLMSQLKVHKKSTGDNISNDDANQLSEDTQKNLDKNNVQLDADLEVDSSLDTEEGKTLDQEEHEIE